MAPSKEVKIYKKPSSKTVSIGVKKRNKQDFIKKYNIKDKILDYYPKIIYLNKKELNRYLNRIKKNIKAEEKFGQEKLIKTKKGFLLRNVSIYNRFNKKQKGFIFYLTKRQIEDLIFYRKGGIMSGGKNSISFSIKQLVKTYKEVIRINSQIYSDKPNNPTKLLAITDKPYNKQELLDLTENLEKDLIDFGDEEVKDLIDLDTIIPNPPPSTQDILEEVEKFPKKYKVLQNEDLIPTTTNPSTNGENILKNILKYPETKR